jgi:hypothetical protein
MNEKAFFITNYLIIQLQDEEKAFASNPCKKLFIIHRLLRSRTDRKYNN